MMEVDTEAENKAYNLLKTRCYDEFVESKGLAVQTKDLASVREHYMEMLPYHLATVSQFYGGDSPSKKNDEMVKDKTGKYTFNRQFVLHLR